MLNIIEWRFIKENIMKKFHKKNTVVGPHQTASAERENPSKSPVFIILNAIENSVRSLWKCPTCWDKLCIQQLRISGSRFYGNAAGNCRMKRAIQPFISISMILDQFRWFWINFGGFNRFSMISLITDQIWWHFLSNFMIFGEFRWFKPFKSNLLRKFGEKFNQFWWFLMNFGRFN